ncbi:MAG: Ig-like domain-containing protein [Pseudonocardiaceae bacterium]
MDPALGNLGRSCPRVRLHRHRRLPTRQLGQAPLTTTGTRARTRSARRGSASVFRQRRALLPCSQPLPPDCRNRWQRTRSTTPVPRPRSALAGKLTQVALTTTEGEPVAGALAGDGQRWTATEPLGYGKNYTYTGTATGADGKAVPVTGSFSTVQPQQTVSGTLNIGDGDTVGIAAPIILKFDDHVADRAAVQRALRAQTSVPTEGSWAWLPDDNGRSQVHWRSKDYLQPGTLLAPRALAVVHPVQLAATVTCTSVSAGRRSSRPTWAATGWSWSATAGWSWIFRPVTGWARTRSGSPVTALTW